MSSEGQWQLPSTYLESCGVQLGKVTRRKGRKLRVRANKRRRWERLYTRQQAGLFHALDRVEALLRHGVDISDLDGESGSITMTVSAGWYGPVYAGRCTA